MDYLLLHRPDSFYFRCYTVLSIFDNSDCNKRGQTSRVVVGVQI